MNAYNLVQNFTSDGLKLSGLFLPGDKKKTASIFIHGFTTDFYSWDFYHTIAKKLKEQGNAIVMTQTRGTGIVTEVLKKDGESAILGSYYEKLDEAHLDITAAINFLINEGYNDFALIGHSLGTLKSVRYVFEGEHKDKISKLILLAPFDKNAFMEVKAPGKWKEFLNIAKKKIEEGKGRDIVPVPEWEDYAMSYETFYSWYEQSDLNCIWDFYRKGYDFPVLKNINIPVKVIIGEEDVFIAYPQLGVTTNSAMEVLKKHIKNCETRVIPGSGHTYVGFEDQVASEVASFYE